MSLWTLTKTTAAIVSIGILATPLLRRLGYLPNDAAPPAKRVGRSKRPARIAETPEELTVPATASTGESSNGSRRSHH